MTRKQFMSWLDKKSLEDQSVLEIGMRVRSADGWTGTILKLFPAEERNEMGHIGLVQVRIDDMSENKTPSPFYFVGRIFVTPAGNFKPLSTGLKFICNQWKKGE